MRIGALEQEAEQEDLPEQIQYRGNDWITGLNSPVTVHPTCVYWIISVIYPMVVMVMVARRCVYTATFGHAESGDGAHVAWHRQRRHLIMKQRQLPAPPEVVYTVAGTPTNPPKTTILITFDTSDGAYSRQIQSRWGRRRIPCSALRTCP